MPGVTHSLLDVKAAAVRATEWREFRKNFLYSQANLAYALHCSRRTVVSIESGQTIEPHPDLLRRFLKLKRKHEKAELEAMQQSPYALRFVSIQRFLPTSRTVTAS